MLHVSKGKGNKCEAKERRMQGEKYVQGEKYSKRNVTLNTFCCAGHVAGINQKLFGILSTLMTYQPPKSCFSHQVTWRSNFALVYFSSYFFPLENWAFESTFSLTPARSLNTTKITDLLEKQTFHLPL